MRFKENSMNQLYSLAFYTLITPAIALGSSTAFAEQSTSSGIEQSQPDVQQNQDDMEPTARTLESESRMQSNGYMASAPANGIHASTLMGAQVTTTAGEEVGAVSDLIIEEDGQVVGIVLGVGGFLGMGEKNVAIGWDDVQKSGNADELELQIDHSRESLTSAPEFETQE
jgi:sporulation protein YlmC with PRC-barrel domain